MRMPAVYLFRLNTRSILDNLIDFHFVKLMSYKMDALETDRSNDVGCQKRKQDEEANLPQIKKVKKALHPGFNDDQFNETEYYFENGLRKVYPYYFSYNTYCKGRWVGQPLMDVLINEFGAYSKNQYEQFVKFGTLTVNQEVIPLNYILKDNDFIRNYIHRHETPVLAAPLKVIYKSEDFVVVDKPPSLPVHPCGRYRHNSVIFILGKEHNLKNLYTIHRLDRLTSGLLLFGLNKTIVAKLMDQMRERKIQKEYLCRVEGDFPEGTIICKEPMEVLSHKIGLCIVDPNGKECTTEFKKLSYNGKSSVVSCKPLTGRTHQIRVHLQYLGYPIVNDPLYNTEFFGPSKGKNGNFGKSKEELIKIITDNHMLEKWLGKEYCEDGESLSELEELKDSETTQDLNESISTKSDDHSLKNLSSISKPLETCPLSSSLSHYTNSDDFLTLAEKYQFDHEKIAKDYLCLFCKHNFRDPKPSELIMFLHAFKYQGDGWNFQTDIPSWAKEDWKEN